MKKESTKKNINEQVIDAADIPLGRLAAKCAFWLQGKHLPEYSPEKDMAVTVRVKNADKIKLTGRKERDKVYHRFTGYPGKIKKQEVSELKEKDPANLVWRSVRGMLPVNTLRKKRLKRLIIETSDSSK